MGEVGEGRGWRRGGGRSERGEQLGKRKGGREKEENFACAKRAPPKERRGRQGGGMVKGGEPPPPANHLIHPSIKKHKYKHFRVMAEFNPRQQYIGVYVYFELFIYSENWVTVSLIMYTIHVQCM